MNDYLKKVSLFELVFLKTAGTSKEQLEKSGNRYKNEEINVLFFFFVSGIGAVKVLNIGDGVWSV